MAPPGDDSGQVTAATHRGMRQPRGEKAPRSLAQPAETQRRNSSGHRPGQHGTRARCVAPESPGERASSNGIAGGDQVPETEQRGRGECRLPLRCSTSSPDPLHDATEGDLFEQSRAEGKPDQSVEDDIAAFLVGSTLVEQVAT